MKDGIDYVPTKRGIIFGHHYASIAGTGPIVGPAIGVIWGWLPALLWVMLGSIFMGAVHDFGVLVITMYPKRRGGLRFIVTDIPCVIMLIITNWAMVKNEEIFLAWRNWLLATIGGGIFVLALWMTVEAAIPFLTLRGSSRRKTEVSA